MDELSWQESLRERIVECRRNEPALSRDGLGPLQLQQFRVEGGFLQSWLRSQGPLLLNERRALPAFGISLDPLIVIHGDMPALVACGVLLEDGALDGEGEAVAMLEDEYSTWMRENPEPTEFAYHLSSWSFFRPADATMLDEARALGHAIDPTRTYFNHVTGTLWAPRCGLQVENLWAWDGAEMSLVEEAIRHVRY